MCKRDDCERHEYDYGYCLPHLKEEFGLVSYEVRKPKSKSRKAKVDAEVVVTTDETEVVETRESD